MAAAEPARLQQTRLALLLLCFFLSGLAALIYQTAWTRQLGFVFGTSDLAVASVLAAYMGGLAAGAAVVGRIMHRIRRPVLFYGLLELAIGLAALAVPLGIYAAQRLYVAVFGARLVSAGEGGLATALFYLACSFVILLIPTSLMGATLPLLARHAVRREDELGRRVGLLYATNTAGAVAGTILTAFVLLPGLGLGATVGVAIATNLLVFAAAAALARAAPLVGSPGDDTPRAPTPGGGAWILPLVLISGAVSFAYEVLWTRLLIHVLGGSVYAFATMLATFLAGIALGSWLASGRAAADRRVAARGFAWTQVGIGLLSLGAYQLIDATPDWIRRIASTGDARLLADVIVSAAILLPSTVCIGATFPLAVRILAQGESDAGPASARVYAWNTAGAILGSVGAGFFMIPALGFAGSVSVTVVASAVLAGIAAWLGVGASRLLLGAAASVVVVLLAVRPEPPWSLATHVARGAYFAVGRSATVLLRQTPEGWQLSSNGLVESVVHPPGVRVAHLSTTRWMGMLPAWTRPAAKRMLVVGLGGGVVVEDVPAQLETIDVVEIEARIVTANRTVSELRRRDPLADPRVNVTVNDARSVLLLSRDRYDAIVSQPSHPWTAGASHLYTLEFFELAREHLSEDGVFVQWMGVEYADAPLIRTLVATLRAVFPHVRVYQPAASGVLFAASGRPLDLRSFDARGSGHALSELGIYGAADVEAHLVLDDADAADFAGDAALNTDDRNWLQMRSPGLVRANHRLDTEALFAASDPLARPELSWSRAYLVRRLVAAGFGVRAERVAKAAADPAERALCVGLVALARGERSEALDRLERALELASPSHAPVRRVAEWRREARMALLRLRHAPGTRLAHVDRITRLLAGDPTGSEATVSTGWQLQGERRWSELEDLDGALADVAPHDPAFPVAVRLRVAWRLAVGDEERAREAVRLLDDMLLIGGSTDDLVTRVRAASLAHYPLAADAALIDLIRELDRRETSRTTLRRALRLLRELPPRDLTPARRQQLALELQARMR